VSDLVIQALIKEMSKPENNLQALSWRRLHLSRAKLKASSRTSALLSGFAMVAMVEVQLSNNPDNPLPIALLIAFSVCTTLLVSVHMLALMISTCILPNVEAVASVHGLAAVSESPHETLRYYIEIAWTFSTVFGIILFLVEIALLCWVKFWDIGGKDGSGQTAALVATIMLVPIVILFIAFAVHFYRKLVAHKYERSAKGLEELETMVSQLQTEHHTQGHTVSGDFNGPAILTV
jgi:calcium release-activated calcium channel protein 1